MTRKTLATIAAAFHLGAFFSAYCAAFGPDMLRAIGMQTLLFMPTGVILLKLFKDSGIGQWSVYVSIILNGLINAGLLFAFVFHARAIFDRIRMTPRKFALIATGLYGCLFLPVFPNSFGSRWCQLVTYPTSSILWHYFHYYDFGEIFWYGLLILSGVINAGLIFAFAYCAGRFFDLIRLRFFRQSRYAAGNPLLKTLRSTIESWWKNDRVRVSPSEGQILRIEPGDILQIGEIQAEVTSRSLTESQSGSTLCLMCETPTGIAQLQIDISIDGKTSPLVWKRESHSYALSPHEIEIWSRHHSRRVEGKEETARESCE